MSGYVPDPQRWHQDGDGVWAADHGGVTLNLDLDARRCDVFLAAGGEASPADIEAAVAQLAVTGLTFPDQFTACYMDSGVFYFSAAF